MWGGKSASQMNRGGDMEEGLCEWGGDQDGVSACDIDK